MVFNLNLLIYVLTVYVLSISVIIGDKLERNKYCKSLRLKDGGDVIGINDELYDIVRLSQWAVSMSSIEDRNAILSPTIIAIPRSENEILDIVEFANECGYTISIRSGGHQYSGLSSCNGSNGKCIQIDMKHFDYINYDYYNGINIDDGINSITIGSGVKLVDLYRANNANDVVIIGGVCGSVGSGGHYQSSSQSLLSRSLGLGMDYIIRVKIITANGEIRNLYKNTQNAEEKDLFWAILGGSPGSWGIIIEYEFEPIKNSDYPYSAYYSYGHFYTKQGFNAFLTAFMNLLNNPYYYNYNDMAVFFIGNPLLSDPNTSSSMIGTGMTIFLGWTGKDNDDIYSVIPNHPQNKTFHQELVQPFVDIDSLFALTQINGTRYEEPISISELFSKLSSITPPSFRTLSVQSVYNATKMNELFSDTLSTKQWIASIVDKYDELAGDSTDNIGIIWQFWDPLMNEGSISDDISISHDPLENDISYPLRSIKLQTDNKVLFGDGDSYSDNIWSKAKQYQYELKQILTDNIIKSDLKSYAYTDLMANEYDLNKQFNQFYNYREDIYNKLKDIKKRVDGNNIFKGPLTIPLEPCDHAKQSYHE